MSSADKIIKLLRVLALCCKHTVLISGHWWPCPSFWPCCCSNQLQSTSWMRWMLLWIFLTHRTLGRCCAVISDTHRSIQHTFDLKKNQNKLIIFIFNFLPAVYCGVPEGWHVHQCQRPVQDKVCGRHVRSVTVCAHPVRHQCSPERPGQGSSEGQEEQKAHELMMKRYSSKTSFRKILQNLFVSKELCILLKAFVCE